MAELDLLPLAARYGIPLQRCGNHFVACCPFHAEKTPSFKIRVDHPTRWRCYGACASGGDAIDLVGRLRFGAAWNPRDRGQFRAARDELASDLGARDHARERRPTLPQTTRAAPVTASVTVNQTPCVPTQTLYVLDKALGLYETELWGLGGGRATPLRYLRTRGFMDDTLRRQRIGYCSGTQLLTTLESIGFPVEIARTIGLIHPRPEGARDQGEQDLVEYLRGRIVIADLDARGRARYLTGRKWAPWLGRASKYLCQKAIAPPLYGLAQLPADGSPVLVTESLADWLTLRQWGYAALGTSGTGLSRASVRALRELGRPLVYVVQNDDPGRAAGARWQQAVGRGRVLNPPGAVKDVNDLLVAGREVVFRDALEALLRKEKITHPSIVS
jgi:DNA primase